MLVHFGPNRTPFSSVAVIHSGLDVVVSDVTKRLSVNGQSKMLLIACASGLERGLP